jgi:hypothetical protein
LVQRQRGDLLTEYSQQGGATRARPESYQDQAGAEHGQRADDDQGPEQPQQQRGRAGLPVGGCAGVVPDDAPAGRRGLGQRRRDQQQAYHEMPGDQPPHVDQGDELAEEQHEQGQTESGGELGVAGRAARAR